MDHLLSMEFNLIENLLLNDSSRYKCKNLGVNLQIRLVLLGFERS